MSVFDHMKRTVGDIADSAKDALADVGARDESDASSDAHVAGSRASNDGEDGPYVGRTGPDIDSDVEQSGAEAPSEEARRSR